MPSDEEIAAALYVPESDGEGELRGASLAFLHGDAQAGRLGLRDLVGQRLDCLCGVMRDGEHDVRLLG